MKFIAQIITQEGIVVDGSKVEMVLKWEKPKSVTELQSLLGLAESY